MIDASSLTAESAAEALCAICHASDQRLNIPEFAALWKDQGQQGFICVYCVIESIRSNPENPTNDSPEADEEWDQLLASIYLKTGVRQTLYFNPASWQELKAEAMNRHGRWCYLCDLPIARREKVHLDHVIPRRLGGPNYWTNLRPTHAACNLWKRDRPLSDLDLDGRRKEREALWLAR